MRDLVERLKKRKIVQWAVAYAAGAWVLVEGVLALGEVFELSRALQRGVVVVAAFGLPVTLVLAWYHGERGRQKIGGTELLIVAAILLTGAVTLRVVTGGSPDSTSATATPARPAVSLPPETPAPDPSTVAVLPFADLSRAGDHAYLGDGIAEELIGVLSRLPGVRVTSRTSAFSLREEGLDVTEIGRRLGVAHVLEGSVRRSDDRLRIQASLVEVEDGFPLWSERFDTDAADIFQIQDSIALAVARALRVQLSPRGPELTMPGQTEDHLAQDLYFKGRFAWNRRSKEGLEDAVGFFESALARDSTYARALAGLADAWAVLGFYDYRPPSEAFPPAQRAARRALEIDSTLAEPHATLGYAALYYDWDSEAAERHFLRSIELDPGYPVAHQWYANLLTATGRFDAAEREMRRASELDPLSTIAFVAIGWVRYHGRSHLDAIRHFEQALERDPNFELTYLWSGYAHEALGRLDEAERLARRAVELSEGSAISRAFLARVLGRQGSTSEARQVLETLGEEGRGGYVPSYEVARAWVGVGDPERALVWLRRALEERAHSMVFLRVDPQLDSLRDRPDFRRLEERVGVE